MEIVVRLVSTRTTSAIPTSLGGAPLMFAHFIPNGTYRSTGQDVEAAGLTTSNDRSLDYVAAASLDEESPLIEITR